MAKIPRLTDDDEMNLAEPSRADGTRGYAATPCALRDASTRQGHEKAVRELSQRARTRYSDLLDRLAQ